MTESSSLQEIHDELKELRLLYGRLIDRLIPIGEPTQEEREAITRANEIADEEELFRALGVHNTDKAQSSSKY
ncbi:MAG: hypothetical protein ABSE82_04345 [Nitrososphaerales archaeon]|jgi:hypothetical protein